MATVRGSITGHGPKTYLFAAAVGIIGGLVGTAFQVGRTSLKNGLMGPGNFLEESLSLSSWERFLFPVGAFLAASLLAYGLTRRRESQGMANVMEAVSLKRGQHLKVRATIARALSSFVLVAGGGSVGREGPIVYLSASLGTRFSRLVKVPMQRLGLFTGCGVAAGMASAYYSTIGAALFAMEVVLGNFAIDIFAPVVVAAVVANFVTRGFAEGPFLGLMKPHPLYPDLPAYTNVQPAELLIYIMLGGLAACGAWLFIKTMAKTELLMNKIPVPAVWRLPIGGVLVGLISIARPEVWGGGHDVGNDILHTMPPFFEFIVVMFVLKILAIAITVGSGGSSGLFSPSLFVGLCVGMVTGIVAQKLFPGLVSDPRSYGTVGMAAGLAATTQAPIMAIFLVVEMTGEFELVPPLLLATLAGSVCARALGLESIYLSPLRKRGIRIPEGIEETALTTTRVNDIMRTEAVWISETASFDMIVGMVKKTRKDFIYVVDDKLRLSGWIRLHDIKGYLGDEELGTAVIAADLVVTAPTARPNETLADIMERFDDAEVHELAVVDENKQIIGVVDRRDLISALSVEVLKSGALRAKFVMPEGTTHYVEMPPGHKLARVAVPDAMVGRTFGSTNFRRKTNLSVLTIVRKRDGREKRTLPEPDIELREGDYFIVMGSEDAVKEAGGEI